MLSSAMTPLWAAEWVPTVLNVFLIIVSLWLILLVLIQRGKGGGLSGAFGGAGGSSAFGSRAGDTFTKITIYSAAVWVLLIMFMIKLTQPIDPLEESAAASRRRRQNRLCPSNPVRGRPLLYSMTGFGEAQIAGDTLSLAVELRAVNNRHLKVTLRAPEPYNLLEPEIEKLIRRTLKRGTIQCHLHCRRQAAASDYRLNSRRPGELSSPGAGRLRRGGLAR